MLTRVLLAGFHLLGLGIGLGAVWARGRALTSGLDGVGLRAVFLADTFWRVARGEQPDTRAAPLLARISFVQNHLQRAT